MLFPISQSSEVRKELVYGFTLFSISLSNILDNDGTTEIGLQFFLTKASPFHVLLVCCLFESFRKSKTIVNNFSFVEVL